MTQTHDISIPDTPNAGTNPVLEVRGMTRRFGGLVAVNNVSFEVRRGEIFGLIGPNGAGKTTLFNLMTGLTPPTSGTLIYHDMNITRLRPHRIAALGIARTFQNIRLFGELTALQNVMIAQHIHTHTGVLASRPINDNWSWSAGIVAGWNDFTLQDGANFIGGITYTDPDYGSLAFAIVTGDNSTVNLSGVGPFANRTMYSVVWNRTLTSRWNYVFQHDLGVQQNAVTLTSNDESAVWYSINQYLFYKINCCWTAGLRFEWFRDDDGFNVTGLRPGNAIAGDLFAGNFYELTAGLNYKPTSNANLAFRPEVRYDWYNGRAANNGDLPYNAGQSRNQFTYGFDLIYQY